MCSKEIIAYMEKIIFAFRHMQQNNQAFREYVAHLQNVQASMSLGCVPTNQRSHKPIFLTSLMELGTTSKISLTKCS
jgi:hypothetical protein